MSKEKRRKLGIKRLKKLFTYEEIGNMIHSSVSKRFMNEITEIPKIPEKSFSSWWTKFKKWVKMLLHIAVFIVILLPFGGHAMSISDIQKEIADLQARVGVLEVQLAIVSNPWPNVNWNLPKTVYAKATSTSQLQTQPDIIPWTTTNPPEEGNQKCPNGWVLVGQCL